MIFELPLIVILCMVALRRLNPQKGFALLLAAEEWVIVLNLLEASMPATITRGRWMKSIVDYYIKKARAHVQTAKDFNLIIGSRREG